ncbi:MAG TPA: barstar family protein [Mycobacteriales bacterium]|nr:barstar family protein [Mycobacteriales bacterium]
MIGEAERQGVAVHRVGPAATKAELLTQFARALEFPGWVGRNWDALSDALRDLSWLPEGAHVVVWTGASKIDETAYEIALEVLQHATAMAAETPRPLTVLLTAD